MEIWRINAARLMAVAAILLVIAQLGACGGTARTALSVDGRELYRANACSTCHGGRGEGAVGPALASVTATFPSCADHVAWVRLGSDRWKQDVGQTYGADSKPVTTGMPSFEGQLSDIEVRTVVAYERIEFGGVDEATAVRDCGL